MGQTTASPLSAKSSKSIKLCFRGRKGKGGEVGGGEPIEAPTGAFPMMPLLRVTGAERVGTPPGRLPRNLRAVGHNLGGALRLAQAVGDRVDRDV